MDNAIISAILGALVGAWITYRFSLGLIVKQNSLNAAAKLRASFAPTLAMIYLARHHGTHDRPDDDAFIKNNLILHAAAVEEFAPFVPKGKRDEYQKAWEEYRQAARKDIYTRAADERIVKEEESRDVAYGEIIEKSIHDILEYAGLK